MSEISVQLKDGIPVEISGSTTVADALKKLDRDRAKQALAAKVRGIEVDLNATLDSLADRKPSTAQGYGEWARNGAWQIDPILPNGREGLDVLRHSTAHLL